MANARTGMGTPLIELTSGGVGGWWLVAGDAGRGRSIGVRHLTARSRRWGRAHRELLRFVHVHFQQWDGTNISLRQERHRQRILEKDPTPSRGVPFDNAIDRVTDGC